MRLTNKQLFIRSSRLQTILTWTISLFSILLLSACATQGVGGLDEKSKNPGTFFLFSETQAGSKPVPVRMFINDDYMRIDDSSSPGDFVLFDRKQKIINNVVADGKTIFVIKAKVMDVRKPIEISYTETKQKSSALMKRRQGMEAFHYQFSANGKSCYNVVAVKDYMPDALEAFKEFRQVLAGEHAKTMSNIPGEEYDACDLALNIFESTTHLKHGFPVREWDEHGYQRFLVDAKSNIVIPEEMLQLPEGYTPFSIGN